jgi:hypothetical protein
MGKRKKSNEIQNDRCLACQCCVWNEEADKYTCDIEGCRNNSKFQVYKPSFLRKKEND